jgi:hypothetical protein
MTAQTRLSKAPSANRDIASSSPLSAVRVSKAAIDSVSFVLCRSLKSHNFFIIAPCSASMRKAIRKSLAEPVVGHQIDSATDQAGVLNDAGLEPDPHLAAQRRHLSLRADRMSSRAVKFVPVLT